MFDFLVVLIGFVLKVQVVRSLSFDYFYNPYEGVEMEEVVGSTTYVFINDKYIPFLSNLDGITRKEYFLFYLRSFAFNSKALRDRNEKYFNDREQAEALLKKALKIDPKRGSRCLGCSEYYVSYQEILKSFSKEGGKILNELFSHKRPGDRYAMRKIRERIFD